LHHCDTTRSCGTRGGALSAKIRRRGAEAAGVLAVEAGCDVLLVCHDAELQAHVHAALLERAERDEALGRGCHIAARRSLALRRR
jgi:beta-glucosidase-like glycosyl hydrolase